MLSVKPLYLHDITIAAENGIIQNPRTQIKAAHQIQAT
jgi:hypothetical protein